MPVAGERLNRLTLEYHLTSLTSRSQESAFENFARRLAQLEVCPNLMPHTGPTGGGDSKVDTETYPVAETIALSWFSGTPNSTNEKWAFAFSAKADWKPTLNSDIAKVAGTGRGYTKAFFITNQFVRDKERAIVEDDLKEKYGLDVKVFDRNWICDRVFLNQRESIAIEELGLPRSLEPLMRRGPNDTARATRLEELEQSIELATSAALLTPLLVDDCIEAAILCASLERPRSDTDGRFLRATRVADRCGTKYQQLAARYQWAWRTYFWFEDFRGCAAMYLDIEQRVRGTTNVMEAEWLVNLWRVLHVAHAFGALSEKEWNDKDRRATIDALLQVFAMDEARPSARLQARFHLLFTKVLVEGVAVVDEVCDGFDKILGEADGLLGFPMETLVGLVNEIGPAISASARFDRLIEHIAEVETRRKGDVAGATVLLTRGRQQVEQEKPYEALATLGRALPKLYKRETRDLMVSALYACAAAYREVGLLWAAQGTLSFAASIAIDEYHETQSLTYTQAACYERLKWLELRLGRLPRALAWHEVDRSTAVALAIKEKDSEAIREFLVDDVERFDSFCAAVLLSADLRSLAHMERLYDSLTELGLVRSAGALRFALGHPDPELDEAVAAKQGTSAEEYFLTWRNQYRDLLPQSLDHGDSSANWSALVLGCRFNATVQRTPPCVAIAEALLSALEAFLATARPGAVIPLAPLVRIEIGRGDELKAPIEWAFDQSDSVQVLRVKVSDFDPNVMPKEIQESAKRALLALLLEVVAHAFFVRDVESTMSKLIGDDRAIDRAVNYSHGFTSATKVLGVSAKLNLKDWSEGTTLLPLQRRESWEAVLQPLSEGDSASQAGRFVRHSDIWLPTTIRAQLWDDADWHSTLFKIENNPDSLPIIAPVFSNAVAARAIFRYWLDEFGGEDTNEVIRVVLLRGIIKSNPLAYRLLVGHNPTLKSQANRLALAAVRMSTSSPRSAEHVDAFLEAYRRHGRYAFMAAVQMNEPPGFEILDGCSIIKREFFERQAQEIGERDPDAVSIFPDDDPVVPSDHEASPVRALLARLRAES